MKKIVLITNIPSPYRVDLFYYMQNTLKEYDIHIVYTSANEDNRNWKINDCKLINSYILKSKIIKIKNDIDTRYVHIPSSIGKILNKLHPNIIIAWEYNLAAIEALIWSKKNDCRFIHLTDGTLYSERNINTIQKITRKIIIQNCNAAIASSTKAREKLISWGLDSKKIATSYLTFDLSKIEKKQKDLEGDEGRVLYVGSMVKRKGLDLLIESLPYITTNYQLRIVGSGSKCEMDKLEQLANRLGVKDNICFCGYKDGDELFEEYNKARVFVLPTREDCYGLVLVEALCFDVPIVASKYADGAYDIVKNEKNGFIVDPYNSSQMGKSINKILLSDTYKQNAKKMDKRSFQFENVVKGYIKAIKISEGVYEGDG